MRNVKTCGYGKVNLFLDVIGKNEGYHMLDSLVCTISLCNTAHATMRSDKKIVIKEDNFIFAQTLSEDTNAYKAAKLFMDTFDTYGANISLKRDIPMGSGLGGSSADIVAVLKAMQKLYMIDCDLKPLADKLGSDSGYLLSGGYARLSGRGDIVQDENLSVKIWMVIVTPQMGVTAKECFDKYDEMQISSEKKADDLINSLHLGIINKHEFFNALYDPAKELNPDIKEAYDDIYRLSPSAVCMSGSGSSVFGIFENYDICLWAKEKLKKKYKQLFVVETLTQRELKKREL